MTTTIPLSDVEHREIRDQQVTEIMLLVDKLVDFETNLATLRAKGRATKDRHGFVWRGNKL